MKKVDKEKLKIRTFIESLMKNKINITSNEISDFLFRKGLNISAYTVAAYKASITRKQKALSPKNNNMFQET